MDLSDTETNITILCGLAMIVGVFGVVVPLLPGVALCWISAVVWAFTVADGGVRWGVVVVATLIAATGAVVKYAWPGRNLKRGGVPNTTLLLAGLLGIVGFFVIPVIGLVIGFVLGVYLAELVRLGDSAKAWPSTKHAMRAAGLSMLVEMAAALAVAFVWVVGLILV